MIRFEHLEKSFGKTKVLRDLSLDLLPNHCYALLGPNGSGKTTLMKSLLGMVIPDSGTISSNGISIRDNVSYRSEIGYMPQIGQYPQNMTIAQVFDMIRDMRKSGNSETDEELFQTYQIEAIQQKRMGTLSGGTRQKVSACLAFLFNPKVLILDEPTAGLDPMSSEQLKFKIRKETNRGKTIVISSHILSDLDDICTDVIYLQDGQLLINESYEALVNTSGSNKLSAIIAGFMSSQIAEMS